MDSQIIDFYDDSTGSVLKQLMPEKASLPDFVKEAAVIDRQNAHPGEFAVVMVKEGHQMPRFPITDPGNTWLSALYFLDRHDALPGDVQKVAAVNIKAAMQHHGLPVLDVIEKIASDEDPGSNIVDISAARPQVAVIRQTVQDDDARSDAQYALERADGSKLYPLNNAQNAATAAQYFDTHAHEFHPRERREYAVKTAAALDRAGLPVTEKLASYAGEGYSNNLQGFIDQRYIWMVNRDDGDAIAELQKIAAERRTIDPDTFAERLAAWDQGVGLDAAWDREIPDAWMSTFFTRPSLLKTAAKKAEVDPEEVFRCGSESCTAKDLQHLAMNGKFHLRKIFDEKVVSSFCKEPIAVYKSMPKPQQVVLCRMASESKSQLI